MVIKTAEKLKSTYPIEWMSIQKKTLDMQVRLNEPRATICEVSTASTETVSYYEMLGSIYNGRFSWFSYKKTFVRLRSSDFWAYKGA